MNKIDDFRLRLGNNEYVPIIVGGMGTDISTREMAWAIARSGGIGHLSDAMLPVLTDRYFGTQFTKNKLQRYKSKSDDIDKSSVQFELSALEEATKLYVESAVNGKQGSGAVYINIMEKLTMNNSKDTMKTRLSAAMDAGIEGITLSAGLHLGSLALIENHPRFRDVQIGIIVSSVRALKVFLLRAKKLSRLPDFIVVEGPLAGGHLGFGMEDWSQYDLKDIFLEVLQFLKKSDLDIPVIPAGGIFTGSDGVEFMKIGAAGIQVATRFVVAKESGLPDKAKQEYFKASEEDITVNQISPTGYPMRMLKVSPAINSGIRPNCEALGYLLSDGKCSYLEEYDKEKRIQTDEKISIKSKTCLCSQMKAYNVWTCGQTTYKLKDTTNKLEDGSYQPISSEHIFKDYQYSTDQQILLPSKNEE